MNISETIKNVLIEKGVSQVWVVNEMNSIDRTLQMNKNKMSSIVCGVRKMTGEELIAFCKATETNPDIFLPKVYRKDEKQAG